MKRIVLLLVVLSVFFVGCAKPYTNTDLKANVKSTGKIVKDTKAETVINSGTDDDAVDTDFETILNTWNSLNVDKSKKPEPARETKVVKSDKTTTRDARTGDIITETETVVSTATPEPPEDASIVYMTAMAIILIGLFVLKNWILALILAIVVLIILIIYKRKRR